MRLKHLAGLGMVAMAGIAIASDPYSADFSLRLPAALNRLATYADVAAVGNASAGSKWSTSVNPASADWQPMETPWKLSLTPQGSVIAFDEGTRLYVISEAANWQTKYGTFQPAAVQLRSNTDSIRQGPDIHIDGDYFQIQYAIRPRRGNWAVGANLNYTHSEVELESGEITLGDSRTESWSGRLGVLYEPARNLRVGLVGDYGVSESHNKGVALTAVGPVKYDVRDTGHQGAVRPGVSYEYAKDSTVYGDYQYLWLEDASGSAVFNRFGAGVDHQLIRGVFVRGGILVDTEGHVAWTTGVGLSVSTSISIDAAYQYDMFPELENELGKASTLVLSVSFGF